MRLRWLWLHTVVRCGLLGTRGWRVGRFRSLGRLRLEGLLRLCGIAVSELAAEGVVGHHLARLEVGEGFP